ncbi:MAG: SusC/RagA family TonB-linked outer membrane protein [Prolixibacteraceae bacterium]|jgi:TonB-linked SusC/RagA family outer membrane protein|nr:SusC/RagA family TonB-linked outer membrane protein [Prolixibacteraceae bacterium]
MKKNLRIYLLVLATVFAQLTFAQSRTITGNVIEEGSGEPLVGVTIVIQGTTNGTVTNYDGNYSLTAENGQTLAYSFIGFKTEEVEINNQTQIDVALKPEYENLGEMIVIGYGVQRKEDKTGAVSHITSDELVGGAVTNPLQAIVGKAAGVVVTKGGGNPTDDAKIKIRGSAGISGATNTNPLYVIDGIPGADPNMVAPSNIESMNILKDAASTAIYGSQGANGVIIITTKSGKSGAAVLNFSSTTSIDNVAGKLDFLSADQYRSYASKYELEDIFVDAGANTDWQDEIYRTGVSQQYNLSVSGGNEKSTYYASVTHQNNEGIIDQSSRERTMGNLNVTHKAFNDKLTIKGGLNFTTEEDHLIELGSNSRDDILYQTYRRNPTDSTHNADGSIAYYKADNNRGFDYVSPLAILQEQTRMDEREKVIGNVSLNYEIIKGLNFKVVSSYLSSDKKYTFFRPVGMYGGQGDDSGEGQRYYELNTQKTLESTLNYNTSFSDVHNLDVLLGYSWQENNFSKFGVNARNSQSNSVGTDNMQSFIDLVYGDASSEANMSRLIGFFGRFAYNYNNKYYIGASLRSDGSSKFGENNKWGFFPTASLGWNMHSEDFMQDADWLSQLKLRASYGVSGNQSFDSYYSKSVFNPSDIVTDPVTGNAVLVWSSERNANPDLKWEQTAEYNGGIDFGFFDNRLSGSIEAYSKNTTDMLNEYSVPVPPNKYPKTWANSGSMTNKGVEIFVTAHAVNSTNLSWKTSVGVSKNVGVVTDLGEFWTEEDSKQGRISGQGIVGGDDWTMFVDSGQGIGNFFVYEYLGISDGSAMYLNRFKDEETEPDSVKAGNLLDIKDRYIAGNATPDVEVSWSNNLTFYKNWTLDFSFRGLFGQQVYNHTKANFSSPIFFPDANVLENATKYMDEGFFDQFTVPSDEFLENASFIRLDYFSLGYTINFKDNDYIKNLKFSVMGNNLLVFTNYTGADPEMSIDGLDYGVDTFSLYPKSRTISFGINATF